MVESLEALTVMRSSSNASNMASTTDNVLDLLGKRLICNVRSLMHMHHSQQAPCAPNLDALIKPPAATPLTLPEAVIVKDVWNKLRAQKEVAMETFFKRLLLEVPELDGVFEAAFESMPDYFFEMFDSGVRSLCPHTENVASQPMIKVSSTKNDAVDTMAEYGTLFFDIGVKPQHWLKARQVWMWTLSQVPYLEAFDCADLEKGTESALYKFFNTHVMAKMVAACDRYHAAFPSAVIKKMTYTWQNFARCQTKISKTFYPVLFKNHPQLLPVFERVDMDSLLAYSFESIEIILVCLAEDSDQQLMRELHRLGCLYKKLGIPSFVDQAILETILFMLEKAAPEWDESLRQAWVVLLRRICNVMKLPRFSEERLLKKAREYLDVIATEQAWEGAKREQRWQEIEAEVRATGTYTHSHEELTYGAQLAWRNASKCIGRLQWRNLIVRDRRHVTDPDEMFQELEEHLRIATNGGNVQTVMTVFRPKRPKERWGPRIWNSQLLRYAAYEMPDGSIMGDAANLALTRQIIEKTGWQPPAPCTPYDVLPLVIETPCHDPKLYAFQPADILEVEIEHPTVPGFKDLGLRWCAVPAISNFRIDIGGVTYACAPFNGWYMGTEIARNLLEEDRYDQMAAIATVMGLNTHSERTLWRDRVALEMNVAILHSFKKNKVTMVDHHAAARQFLTHDQREKKAGRECPADYGWIVPPAGGSTCPVWHHQMRDFELEPAYRHAADRWVVEGEMDGCPL